MSFEIIRNSLLEEAKASPNLLSDLAGMETYIAESYSSRSFIELLQNADDAKAKKFKVLKHEDKLYVANDGRDFDLSDIESICRSASSKKTRGETIGYRGIGFKSVVSFAKEIYIISGEYEFEFSKERTKNEIPNIVKVPLIRIPHKLLPESKIPISNIVEKLKSEGYKSIFVFTGTTANEIEIEFKNFENNSLLFLRNIIYTEISLNDTIITNIDKNNLSDTISKIKFNTNGVITNWLISTENSISLAFQIKDGFIIKLPKEESFVYTFLPTESKTGFGFLINGDFSTEPSRRHIIFDDITTSTIDKACEHIFKLLEQYMYMDLSDGISIINCLTPYNNPRILALSKISFEKVLLERLKELKTDYFSKVRLCPSWLNNKDLYSIIEKEDIILPHIRLYEIEGFIDYFKYLGAKEIEFNEIKTLINKSNVSIIGCVDIIKHLFQITFLNNDFTPYNNLKLFYSNGERKSINEINTNLLSLDDSFLSLLIERGISKSSLKRIIKTIPEESSEVTSDHVSNNNNVNKWFNNESSLKNNVIVSNIQKWRSAEERTLEILNQNGFVLQDVSKQNIGYDLSGKDPNGNEIQIEIKSISLPGESFKMTNNEIAVAQAKQKSYFVALVRQTNIDFEISLIADPINNLTLNRQCVQWVWECQDYSYNPIKFKL